MHSTANILLYVYIEYDNYIYDAASILKKKYILFSHKKKVVSCFDCF